MLTARWLGALALGAVVGNQLAGQVGAVTVAVAFWVVESLIWPYRSCGRCGETGKLRSWFGRRHFGRCGRCDGSGRHYRVVARVVYQRPR